MGFWGGDKVGLNEKSGVLWILVLSKLAGVSNFL